MKKVFDKYWRIISIFGIILLSLGYFVFFVEIRQNNKDNCLNFLSVLSSFSSIVGILVALWQIGKISNDLEQYKEKQNTSRIATVIEKIKNTKQNIDLKNYEKALIKIEEIKEIILKIFPELKLDSNRLCSVELFEIITTLKENQTEKLPKEVEKNILSILEEILEYFNKLG